LELPTSQEASFPKPMVWMPINCLAP
jgi:hypothetical protein